VVVICLLKILVHKKKGWYKIGEELSWVVLFFYSDGFLGLLGQWFCYANFSQNFLLLGNFFAFILFLGIFFWKEEFFLCPHGESKWYKYNFHALPLFSLETGVVYCMITFEKCLLFGFDCAWFFQARSRQVAIIS